MAAQTAVTARGRQHKQPMVKDKLTLLAPAAIHPAKVHHRPVALVKWCQSQYGLSNFPAYYFLKSICGQFQLSQCKPFLTQSKISFLGNLCCSLTLCTHTQKCRGNNSNLYVILQEIPENNKSWSDLPLLRKFCDIVKIIQLNCLEVLYSRKKERKKGYMSKALVASQRS